MTRPFQHPAHVPVAFAVAVWRILCMAGTREDQALAWEELDKVPRRQALEWIKEVLVANPAPRLAGEMAWWERQLRMPDN
jgi:hypothetical protein